MNHLLKILPEYFENVFNGKKTFEIRLNDRDYQVGDTLQLKEWDNKTYCYTGRRLRVEVTYITTYQQKENFVVMAIKKLNNQKQQKIEDWKTIKAKAQNDKRAYAAKVCNKQKGNGDE